MTSDQSPGTPAKPSSPPAAQAPQRPPQKPCADGLFLATNVQSIDRSPDPATVRERLVTFDVDQVRAMPARLILNLFDDVCVVALRQKTQEAGPVPVWSGAVEGVLGSQVTLIFNPGAAAGSIVMPPQAFQLELVRDGLYRVREVDVTKYPNEHPPMTPPTTTPPSKTPTKAPPKKTQPV